MIKSRETVSGRTAVDAASVRRDFPTLNQQVHDRPLVYLDNAATTLKPKVVIEAVTDHYQHGAANVHRGVHFLSQQATERYEATRDLVRDLIGASEREEIIFTSGTTAGINLVAQSWGQDNLSAGDEILITEMEHHSNIVPWQSLRLLPKNMALQYFLTPHKPLPTFRWTLKDLGAIF